MKSKRKYTISILILFLFFESTPVYANPILNRGSGSSFNQQIDSWTNFINGLAPMAGFILNSIFVIMFLFGIIRMGYSMVTKTGQVMKISTGILIWVPITVFLMRLFVLFTFTTNAKDVTLFASSIIKLLQYSGYYFTLGMVLIGLIFFLLYKLIHHPEFGRWSKRLWGISAILVILITIMPHVLGAV